MSRKVAELYVVPDNVAWLDDDSAERLYLTVVPQGRTVILEGTARVIWLIASEGGEVVEQVAGLFGLPEADVEGDIERFLAELLDAGLLKAVPSE